MSQHPRQTLIYSPTFRWNGDLLEQEVQIIQHYPERDRDVGIFREWHPVKIGDKQVFKGKGASRGMPQTLSELKAQGPKPGRYVIEADGGTSCNIPGRFGKGYGSYQINGGEIVRVEFGMGHSNNSAEIRTLVAALEALDAQEGPSTEKSVLLRSDSKIALKWVKCGASPKEKTSEGFREAITLLRAQVIKFRSVKTEWRNRNHSVALFGH
jgi:ribonuclease HI